MKKKDLKLLESFDKATSNKFFESLKRESDRGAVLVSIAILDEIITARLIQLLNKGNSESRDRLLKPPLGSVSGFASKIDLAFCVGLIPESFYNDIRSLNRLRNKCAHNWDQFYFTPEIINQFVEPMFVTKSLRVADDLGKDTYRILHGKEPLRMFGMVMAALITFVVIYLRSSSSDAEK